MQIHFVSSGIFSTFVCVPGLLFEGRIHSEMCISGYNVDILQPNLKMDQFCHCQEYRLAKSLATDAHTGIPITSPCTYALGNLGHGNLHDQ